MIIKKIIFISLFVGAMLFIGFNFSHKLQKKNTSQHSKSQNNSDKRSSENLELPIPLKGDSLILLETFKHQSLLLNLQKELDKNPSYKSLIQTKKMAVGLVDLNNPYQPKYAAINEDDMMYAASLPKIAVLLAVQEAIYEHKLEETQEIRDDMKIMISRSSNLATTRLIDLVGFDYLEQTVRSPKYNFYNESNGGGLWVGKRYSKEGPTNREPLKNLSHAATVHQVCRFYYHLAFGQLVSDERSRDMLEIMTDPKINHKFVYSLSQIAPNASLYRKSGSWKNWHADSVLVWGKDRRYILVALIEDPDGEQLIRNLIKPVEEVLFMNSSN